MLGQNEKDTINYTCTEQAFPEFPNLLFGPQLDDSASYFDATFYLQQQSQQLSVKNFFVGYSMPIKALAEAYGIQPNDISKINQAGHYLIHVSFVYLFISYVDPYFLAYICDRIHELMTSGTAISDSYLFMEAQNRLSPEIINTILKKDEQTKQSD